MKSLFTAIICLLMTGCTYSINLIHTEGEADDVVNETSTPTADISPTLSIPAAIL